MLEIIRKILLIIFAVFTVIFGFTFATIKLALFFLIMPFVFLLLILTAIVEDITRKD